MKIRLHLRSMVLYEGRATLHLWTDNFTRIELPCSVAEAKSLKLGQTLAFELQTVAGIEGSQAVTYEVPHG